MGATLSQKCKVIGQIKRSAAAGCFVVHVFDPGIRHKVPARIKGLTICEPDSLQEVKASLRASGPGEVVAVYAEDDHWLSTTEEYRRRDTAGEVDCFCSDDEARVGWRRRNDGEWDSIICTGPHFPNGRDNACPSYANSRCKIVSKVKVILPGVPEGVFEVDLEDGKGCRRIRWPNLPQ